MKDESFILMSKLPLERAFGTFLDISEKIFYTKSVLFLFPLSLHRILLRYLCIFLKEIFFAYLDVFETI